MSRIPAAERREELIEATAELLIAQGLAATRTRDVAQRTGTGTGLMHHYFGWAELRALGTGRALARSTARLVPFEPGGDPRAALAGFLATAFATEADPIWRLWAEAMEAARTEPVLAAEIDRAAIDLHDRLAGCIEAGVASGAWRCPDPDGSALRILAAHDGLVDFLLFGMPGLDRQGAAAHLARLVALECPGAES